MLILRYFKAYMQLQIFPGADIRRREKDNFSHIDDIF